MWYDITYNLYIYVNIIGIITCLKKNVLYSIFNKFIQHDIKSEKLNHKNKLALRELINININSELNLPLCKQEQSNRY